MVDKPEEEDYTDLIKNRELIYGAKTLSHTGDKYDFKKNTQNCDSATKE